MSAVATYVVALSYLDRGGRKRARTVAVPAVGAAEALNAACARVPKGATKVDASCGPGREPRRDAHACLAVSENGCQLACVVADAGAVYLDRTDPRGRYRSVAKLTREEAHALARMLAAAADWADMEAGA